MSIKNLMEDIVQISVEEVLKKEQDLDPGNTELKEDIVAYVLNRIPPKYHTSERGILHTTLEAKYVTQSRVNILFLIYEAIKTFNIRRKSTTHTDNRQTGTKALFFPHVLGEVLEETTLTIIPDVIVSLTCDGDMAKMIDQSWVNPYITNKATNCHFHFYPDFNSKKMKDKKTTPFILLFKHEKFEEKELEIQLSLSEQYNMNRFHIVPPVLLKAKEGVDISFLYEE